MTLPMLRRAADFVQLYDPSTGEEIDLSLCADETLAMLRDMTRDAEDEQRQAKRQIDAEVMARMDRERQWTMRVPGFELSAPSPALKSEFDAGPLHAELMGFVDSGDLTVEAVDRAVEQVLTYKPRKAGIDALRKGGGPIAEVIEKHERQIEPTRRVTLKPVVR